METQDIQEAIENFTNEDWFSAHNTYCQENDYSDDEIFEFDEDFFETYFSGKPYDAARATHFGEVNWNDEYIRFDGYGNLKSIRKYNIEREIDTEAITEHILENQDLYKHLF